MCGWSGKRVRCIFRFDKSAISRNAVDDRRVFFAASASAFSDTPRTRHCSVKFLLSSPFERSYSRCAVLFIADIVCRLHNSSVYAEERVPRIEKRKSGDLAAKIDAGTLVRKLGVLLCFRLIPMEANPEDQKITIYRYRRGEIGDTGLSKAQSRMQT